MLGAILVQFLKPHPLRKWLGLALLATGLVSTFKVGEQQVLGFDQELLALLAVVLFLTRRWFTAGGLKPWHDVSVPSLTQIHMGQQSINSADVVSGAVRASPERWIITR